MSKRAKRSETLELELRPLAATHGGRNVDGGGRGLANGMLGRGRNLCAGDGLAGPTVTQRPNVAFEILQLQAGIDEQLAVFLGTTGGSADGTVEMSVLQGISVPDCKIALSDVAAFSLSLT